MPVLTIPLSDELFKFIGRRVEAEGHAHGIAYILSLVQSARDAERDARLSALIAEGRASAVDDETSSVIVREAVYQDRTRHGERYAGSAGLRDRFIAAVRDAIDHAPERGVATTVPHHRVVPLRGFSGYGLYGVIEGSRLEIVRLLHDSRDLTTPSPRV